MKPILMVLPLILMGAACSKTNDDQAPAGKAARIAASPGKQVFDQWCAACHAPGPRKPGTASLAVKYGKDMPAALEERTDLTPEVVALFVRSGTGIMPPFRKTEITDRELAELGSYLSKATR